MDLTKSFDLYRLLHYVGTNEEVKDGVERPEVERLNQEILWREMS